MDPLHDHELNPHEYRWYSRLDTVLDTVKYNNYSKYIYVNIHEEENISRTVEFG